MTTHIKGTHKKSGKSIEELLDHYSEKMFGMKMAQITIVVLVSVVLQIFL